MIHDGDVCITWLNWRKFEEFSISLHLAPSLDYSIARDTFKVITMLLIIVYYIDQWIAYMHIWFDCITAPTHLPVYDANKIECMFDAWNDIHGSNVSYLSYYIISLTIHVCTEFIFDLYGLSLFSFSFSLVRSLSSVHSFIYLYRIQI